MASPDVGTRLRELLMPCARCARRNILNNLAPKSRYPFFLQHPGCSRVQPTVTTCSAWEQRTSTNNALVQYCQGSAACLSSLRMPRSERGASALSFAATHIVTRLMWLIAGNIPCSRTLHVYKQDARCENRRLPFFVLRCWYQSVKAVVLSCNAQQTGTCPTESTHKKACPLAHSCQMSSPSAFI